MITQCTAQTVLPCCTLCTINVLVSFGIYRLQHYSLALVFFSSFVTNSCFSFSFFPSVLFCESVFSRFYFILFNLFIYFLRFALLCSRFSMRSTFHFAAQSHLFVYLFFSLSLSHSLSPSFSHCVFFLYLLLLFFFIYFI